VTSNDEIDPQDETWQALERLPTPAPRPDARARFDAMLEREQSAPGRALNRSAWLAIAAGVVLAALLGFGAGARWSRPAAESTARTYMLLLYDPAVENVSPAAAKAIVAEYSAWARGLRAAGNLVSAEKLADDPELQLGPPSAAQATSRIGGFFLIRARDFAEASRIAAECPHIKHGGRVELRAIQPT
jgi:hypothetical protein